MAQATLNGIEIDYTVGGRGRPVILSHGYGATGRMWDGQRRTIGDRYRLITWDMRGHGLTESPDDPAQYSTELTVADIRALLGSLGVRRAVVGDQDTWFLALCEYMAKKIPGARFEVISGAGHASNLDQPEAFDRALLSFLDSLPA